MFLAGPVAAAQIFEKRLCGSVKEQAAGFGLVRKYVCYFLSVGSSRNSESSPLVLLPLFGSPF